MFPVCYSCRVGPADVTPIILAAGASVRMGRTKALLEFDGRTCLEIALEACRGLATPVIVLGPSRGEIGRRVSLASFHVALNDNPESGQTASLKAGLRALPPGAGAFLIYPVDFPLLTAGEVGAVVQAWMHRPGHDKTFFIPSHGMRRGHPVLCRAGMVREFLALPDSAPARTVINLRPQRIAHVDFDRPTVLMDMDRPADYDNCLAGYRARARRETR